MMKSRQRRWIRPSRALGLFAIAGALGGIALVSWPTPARRLAIGGSPPVVSLRPPGGSNAPRSLVDAPQLFAPEELGPTDRCLIEAPQVDDRFAIPAPRVDDRFVVKPLVQGLPVSASPARSRR
jgi:hypothetical protein